MNTPKKVKVVSWEEAQEKLSKNKLNTEFKDIISSISQKLGKSKSYVYELELDFGDKVIEKGVTVFDSCDVERNDFGIDPNKLLSDLSYSEDPLGIVAKNHLEIFSINECENRERQVTTYVPKDKKHIISEPEYNVPLNVIEEGDLFGVFGTLDSITKNKRPSNRGLDWYAVAGNSTSIIDLPIFHSKMGRIEVATVDLFKEFKMPAIAGNYYPGKEQVEFVKKYAPKFKTHVMYFPKQFIEISDNGLKKALHYILLLKGWEQYSPLRHFVFENKVLGDVLRNSSLHNTPQFIFQLYEHLKNIAHEKSFALYPLIPGKDKHVLLEAVTQFKSECQYFTNPRSLEPVVYVYRKTKASNFCVLSLSNLPILRNYRFTKLNEVMKDLALVQEQISKAGIMGYDIGNIKAYGPTGNNSNAKLTIGELSVYQNMLADSLGVDPSKLVPAYGHLSNVIVINHA